MADSCASWNVLFTRTTSPAYQSFKVAHGAAGRTLALPTMRLPARAVMFNVRRKRIKQRRLGNT